MGQWVSSCDLLLHRLKHQQNWVSVRFVERRDERARTLETVTHPGTNRARRE